MDDDAVAVEAGLAECFAGGYCFGLVLLEGDDFEFCALGDFTG